MSELEPFKIEIPESDLDDLRQRLLNTRLPDETNDSSIQSGEVASG